MIEADALWLVPDAAHPVYRSTRELFGQLFRSFDVLDYRAAYLASGGRALAQRVETLVRERSPRLVIYSQFPNTYAYLSPVLLERIRGAASIVGLGYDDEIFFEPAKYFYQACDAVITTDLAGAAWLRQTGVDAYIAHLGQPMEISASGDEDIDISFVGDMSKPGRRAYVDHLEEAGFSVHDYGKFSRHGSLDNAEVLQIYRRSKINLNFTAINPPRWIERHDPLRAKLGQIKGRPFELAAMGKFCLSEWAPCIPHWFSPDTEIGVFKDRDDLLRQVRRFLADGALRREIGRRAKEQYATHWAPKPQFHRIFSEILTRPKRSQAARLALRAPIFLESSGRSRGVALLHALRRMSIARTMAEITRPHAWSLSYWRGFVRGIVDTFGARLSS